MGRKIGEHWYARRTGAFDFDGKCCKSPAGRLTSFPAVADEKTVLVKIEQ
ncbi:MAG: hypothetical protein IPG90_21755 [Bacteroidetes bacterium]|nr:hypothetical protein [Bacteroidota bacterium]